MKIKDRIGTYVVQQVPGESFKAYIPPKLPPQPPLDMQMLYSYLEKATRALAELNSLVRSVPNTSLFLYMYVRKEALLSSQIEGTQSSFSDLMLFEHDQKSNISIDDVEEVSHYVAAINYGLERLKSGFPLSLRLLREMHGVLLQGGRGVHKLPGEFRRSQNWIGGTRPGNALFVPPSPDQLMSCLADFEMFLHDDSTKLPALIKAGLAHVQFETIHPFLDGNGRLGRLLIILLMCEAGLLDAPILYLSLYLKQHRTMYYNLLQEVRLNGNWEAWLEFFLEGIYQSAQQASRTVQEINMLFAQATMAIETLGRAKFSCFSALEYLKKLPQVTVALLARELGVSVPTARAALQNLVSLGIVEEVRGSRKEKIYVYRAYLNVLEQGADPFKP